MNGIYRPAAGKVDRPDVIHSKTAVSIELAPRISHRLYAKGSYSAINGFLHFRHLLYMDIVPTGRTIFCTDYKITPPGQLAY